MILAWAVTKPGIAVKISMEAEQNSLIPGVITKAEIKTEDLLSVIVTGIDTHTTVTTAGTTATDISIF